MGVGEVKTDLAKQLVDDPTFGIFYNAWRARYNQARVILDRITPRLLAYSRLIPSVFTVETKAELFALLDEGNLDALKNFIDRYDIMYEQALREEVERRRKEWEKLNPVQRRTIGRPHERGRL